jgi:phage-related protein
VTKAQELQSIALDIAAGSGKSLEAVSNALAKSAEGQNTALGKLGVGISAAELKTMSFEEITAKLSDTFKNQASQQADTFAGKMARLNVAFDEGKETVGSFVLDAITPMVNTFVKDVVPAIQKFADEIGPKLQPVIKFLGSYIQEVLLPAFKGIWGFINDFLVPIFMSILTPAINGLRGAFEKVQKAISDNSDELKPLLGFMKSVGEFARDTLAPIIGGTLKVAFDILGTIISTTITGFGKIVTAVTKVVNAVKAFIKLMTDNPVTRFFGLSGDNSKGLKAGGAEFDPNIGGDIGDPFSGGGGTTFGGNDPRTFTGAPLGAYSPAMQAAILRREQVKADTERLRNAREAAAAARLGVTGGLSTAERINITVNGAIDAEGTARTIVETLNDSYFRGTGGASNLQAI